MEPSKPYDRLKHTTDHLDQSSSSVWDSHGVGANMTLQLNKLSSMKKYKVSNINFLNLSTRSVLDYEAFGDGEIIGGLRPGGIYTKSHLTHILHRSAPPSGYFEKVEPFVVKTNPDGTVDLDIPYKERVYPPKTLFRCVSVGMLPERKPIKTDPDPTEKELAEARRLARELFWKRVECGRECILPEQVRDEIELMLRQSRLSLPASLLSRIMSRIEKWYHDNGYYSASVLRTGLLDEKGGGELFFEVDEGEISNLEIKFLDKLGNATCPAGNTDNNIVKVIRRALPKQFAVGRAINQTTLKEAVKNIHSLNLFKSVNIVPRQNKTTGSISAEVLLQEQQGPWWCDGWCGVKMGKMEKMGKMDWHDILRPSATMLFGNRNIKGLNRSFEGAITLGNLFDPQDDVDFNLNYTHPYVDGIDNPRRNRTFRATCFKSRKLSPVFRVAATDSPIWVDTKGIKATITEEYTKQSKLSYGLVVEDIKTRDKGGDIAARSGPRDGRRLFRGNGPPTTTLSGTGNDQLAFLQANLTRDNTRFVNGALVGARDVFQVDQGIGIGTKFAFFNRAKVSATRFIPLWKVKEGKGNAAPPPPPPPVLVLHGLYGACVGDLPNHEAFTIGGPHSVRGYNVGEIGASRSKLEVAAEIRVPVRNAAATVYGFAEHGNDMGTSDGLAYMRKGRGSSYGLGIMFGRLRAEYAVDHNTRKGAIFYHVGDRF